MDINKLKNTCFKIKMKKSWKKYEYLIFKGRRIIFEFQNIPLTCSLFLLGKIL